MGWQGISRHKVGLVGHTVRRSGIDNGFVESEDGVFLLEEMRWYLLQVCVKPDTEERLLLSYICN